MTDSPLSPSTRDALEAFRARTDEPISAERTASMVRAALAASERGRRNFVLKTTAFALACVLAVVGFSTLPSESTPVPEVEDIQPSPTAVWRREGSTLRLASGRTRVAMRGPRAMRVVTPDLEVMVLNSVVLFDVSEMATILTAESGEVRWRSDARKGHLRQGERATITSAAPRLSISPRRLPVESCANVAGAGAYVSCLEGRAAGTGLAAETALFQLGLLARERSGLAEAESYFRAYGERFPEGAFAPEASISLMLELHQAGKSADAAEEARRFLARFPDEPRAASVRRWAEQFP